MLHADDEWHKILTPLIENAKIDYIWRLPDIAPVDFPQSEISLESNIGLRLALHTRWLECDQNAKLQISKWYVSEWGRVRRNRESTYAAYIDCLLQNRVPLSIKGVASWSKIASIHNPFQWAIFDARVAFSLNAVQALSSEAGQVTEKFPLLASRNEAVKAAGNRLRACGLATMARYNTDSSAYIRYCKILAKYPCIQTVEMALFAAAPKLAKRILEEPRLMENVRS